MATAANLLAPLRFKSWLSSGLPNAFGTVATYSAGTVTPIATWIDSTAATANTNPVQLNSRGEASIWVKPNTAYKFVEFDSLGNQINATDQVVQSQLITLYGGVDTGAVNAYILNFTASFNAYADGIVIYWVPSNNNTGASTINVNGLGVVALVNPNGSALGANQIVANQMAQIVMKAGVFQLLSIGNFTGVNIGTFGAETAIASAATTDLGSASAHVVDVTGSTTITSFGSSAQTGAPIYVVRFSGAPLLTYNATSLILPGVANIQAGAGDSCLAEYQGSGNWQVLIYQIAAVPAAVSGTFTGTLTGMTATTTGTVNWVKMSTTGAMVYITADILGTSNATTMTMTGLPSSVQPTNSTYVPCARLENNSAFGLAGYASISGGTITFTMLTSSQNDGGPWTGSGTKGLKAGWCVVYPLS